MNQTITSLQHPLVKHFLKLRTDSLYRKENQTLVLEGSKPIKELSHLVKVLYTPRFAPFAHTLDCQKWEVTEAIIKKISGLESPEGIIAEVSLPPFVSLNSSRRVLALDGISDPGNFGTLLRTALAFNWETVYLLQGCCDPFNDKALRAARGAHFKLALAQGSSQQLLAWSKEMHAQTLVADIRGKEVNELSSHCEKRVLVLGNEAHGASQEIKDVCSAVTLRMEGEMESLNVAVAGGILLYLLR